MNTFKLFLAATFTILSFQPVNAQAPKLTAKQAAAKQTVKVYGQCDMCRKRIEKAAKRLDGINYAVWDENTQDLVLTYDPAKKDAADNAMKKIASAGHDTEKYYTSAKAYQGLPGCCRYNRRPA